MWIRCSAIRPLTELPDDCEEYELPRRLLDVFRNAGEHAHADVRLTRAGRGTPYDTWLICADADVCRWAVARKEHMKRPFHIALMMKLLLCSYAARSEPLGATQPISCSSISSDIIGQQCRAAHFDTARCDRLEIKANVYLCQAQDADMAEKLPSHFIVCDLTDNGAACRTTGAQCRCNYTNQGGRP